MIDKPCLENLRIRDRLKEKLETDNLQEALDVIDPEQAFEWGSNEELYPGENKSLLQARIELRDHLYESLCILDTLMNQEAMRYQKLVSVQNQNDLDLYQNFYFLVGYMKGYIKDLERIEGEYKSQEFAGV